MGECVIADMICCFGGGVVARGEVLTLVQREEISRGIVERESGRAIGARIGRHSSVVNREIARNGGRDAYGAVPAQERADRQVARPKVRKVEASPKSAEAVNEGLKRRWSPRQIAARLRVDHPDEPELHVSHEAIYQALYCQAKGQLKVELTGVLRRGGTRRVSRAERTEIAAKRQVIPGLVLISERPAEAEDRAVPGHWESQWPSQALRRREARPSSGRVRRTGCVRGASPTRCPGGAGPGR